MPTHHAATANSAYANTGVGALAGTAGTGTGAGASLGSSKKYLTSGDRQVIANRPGARATIYDIQRDPELKNKNVIRDKTKPVFPFIAGSTYKGEWLNDEKDGFGCQIGVDGSKYEGGWKENLRHGRGTLYVLKGKKYIKKYVGEWSAGRKCGYGIFYQEDGSIYRGMWSGDRMNGDGRMDYTNGDYYTGDWEDGQQKGLGTMHYKNGNKFEGLWLNGLKEGPGRYFYAATQKVYEGEWSDGNPRCGEYREPSPEEMARFGASPLRTQTFSLPALGLDNPRGVLDLSMSSVRLENASKRGMVTREIFTQQDLQAAAEIYSQLDARGLGVLPWFKTGEVFRALGIDTANFDLGAVLQQLGMGPGGSGGQEGDLTLPEVVDVAMCLLGQ